MTTVDGTALDAAQEPEVKLALQAIRRAVSSEGAIPPETETQIQNTLHCLRSTAPYSEAIASLEAVAANLRMIAEAHRAGRCNLHMSKLMRLRKQLLVESVH
jgi:sirohydrochlorin ferrochelatase